MRRMGGNRIPKIIMDWEAEGRRWRGRPHVKWKDRIMESVDGRKLSEEDTLDSQRWRDMLK